MDQKQIKWLLASLSGTFVFLVADIIGDYQEGNDLRHFLIEVFSLVCISTAIFLLSKNLRKITQEHRRVALALTETSAQLGQSERQVSLWQAQHAKLVQGLGSAIDGQMNQWNLSPAEKEIARLLLKGFSFKEISTLRGTSEKTIRQQAQNIYAKAELPGRAELSAFFLEDILSPLQS